MFSRAIRRMLRKKKAEIIVRSESVTEVFEKFLGRKVNPESTVDMGMLDLFNDMNQRLAMAPPETRQKVMKLWFSSLTAESSDQQKEGQQCQE